MTTEEIVWEEIDKVRNENSALLLLIEEKNKEIEKYKSEAIAGAEVAIGWAEKAADKETKNQQLIELCLKADKEIERLKGLLTEIDKSLYIGKDLVEEDILKWYLDVVQTIKEEIKSTLTP